MAFRIAMNSFLAASVLGALMAAGFVAEAKFAQQDIADAEVIAQLRAEARR